MKALPKRAWRLGLWALMPWLFVPGAAGQDYVLQVGSPVFATPYPVQPGQVNLGNGDLSFRLPLVSLPQRGKSSFPAAYAYDSRIWQIVTSGGSSSWQPTNVPGSAGGWRLVTSTGPGTVSSTAKNVYCTNAGQQYLPALLRRHLRRRLPGLPG